MNQLASFDVTDMSTAKSIAHTLSEPSKMPGYAYSLPATACNVGAKLNRVKNSVCHSCYALKGRYLFQNVKDAMAKRLQSLYHPLWSRAMAFMINYHADPCRRKPMYYFRWHDSGDIQGVWHLEKIVEVCKLTPTVTHWVPTREIGFVREFLRLGNTIPDNLIIRLSSPMVGTKAKNTLGLPMSTVGYEGSDVTHCEAGTRGGICGPCRACWSKVDVNYPLH